MKDAAKCLTTDFQTPNSIKMNIASYIDHTILKPETTAADILKLCSEATEAQFAAVCVPPYYVAMANALLAGGPVRLATVVGFPFGYHCLASKIAELEKAIADGADELDMVINIAALKNGDWDYLTQEITDCIVPVKQAGKKIKIIVESGVLTNEELEKCCALYGTFGIDYMKTSTGYAVTGATVEAVAAMRRFLPERIGIKASGGIRSYAFALELINAGATRLGASAGLQLLHEAEE
jgi:deoxyribose-phosphate aldolase